MTTDPTSARPPPPACSARACHPRPSRGQCSRAGPGRRQVRGWRLAGGAASSSAGPARLVAAHITLARAGDASGLAQGCHRKLPAYNAAATVMIAKLTGKAGAA
jgi:hypothetical protein